MLKIDQRETENRRRKAERRTKKCEEAQWKADEKWEERMQWEREEWEREEKERYPSRMNEVCTISDCVFTYGL